MVNEISEYIADRFDIPVDRVRHWRTVPIDEAVARFLPENDRIQIINEGLYCPSDRSEYEKLRAALKNLRTGALLDYFVKSTEGREWYLSNYPPLTLVGTFAHDVGMEYSSRIAQEQRRARSQMEREGRRYLAAV
ncbi:hypothetical protein HYX18_00080 [Candidatus Woesearchaeota archaeon]|nr:hypothetical protein [Candidatus Woesearchaeota archaeon]